MGPWESVPATPPGGCEAGRGWRRGLRPEGRRWKGARAAGEQISRTFHKRRTFRRSFLAGPSVLRLSSRASVVRSGWEEIQPQSPDRPKSASGSEAGLGRESVAVFGETSRSKCRLRDAWIRRRSCAKLLASKSCACRRHDGRWRVDPWRRRSSRPARSLVLRSPRTVGVGRSDRGAA
jgi:hypothetical protein